MSMLSLHVAEVSFVRSTRRRVNHVLTASQLLLSGLVLTLPPFSARLHAAVDPVVEININQTAETTDDIVRVKSVYPPRVFTVPVTIRLTNDPGQDTLVQVRGGSAAKISTQPSGDGAVSSLTLTLSRNGDPQVVYVTGETLSSSVGDILISVQKPGDPFAVYGSKALTVFGLRKNSTGLSVDSVHGYRITSIGSGQYLAPFSVIDQGFGTAVSITSTTELEPYGLDVSAPQIASLKIGFEQTLVTSTRSTSWNATTQVFWEASTPPGYTTEVPTELSLNFALNQQCDTANNLYNPLYSIEPASYKNLTSSSGSTSISTTDSPSQPAGDYGYRIYGPTGGLAGTVKYTYKPGSASINDVFQDWLVLRDGTLSGYIFERFRQNGWQVAVADDSTNAKADVNGNSTNLIDIPVEANPGEPNANDVAALAIMNESNYTPSSVFVRVTR